MTDGAPEAAAFELRQTTGRLYQCLFLARTLYMLKTHSLSRLRPLAEDMEPSLEQVWPSSTREE